MAVRGVPGLLRRTSRILSHPRNCNERWNRTTLLVDGFDLNDEPSSTCSVAVPGASLNGADVTRSRMSGEVDQGTPRGAPPGLAKTIHAQCFSRPLIRNCIGLAAFLGMPDEGACFYSEDVNTMNDPRSFHRFRGTAARRGGTDGLSQIGVDFQAREYDRQEDGAAERVRVFVETTFESRHRGERSFSDRDAHCDGHRSAGPTSIVCEAAPSEAVTIGIVAAAVEVIASIGKPCRAVFGIALGGRSRRGSSVTSQGRKGERGTA